MKQVPKYTQRKQVMSSKFEKLSINLDAPIMEELLVRTRPLQDPNQDECLREYQLGGTHSNRDVRLILDTDTLETLLCIARISRTGRVILNRAGIKMKVKRASTGHIYETLHLTGLQPVPEQAPTSIKIPTDEYSARDWLKWGG